jgi:hypothetical protein
MMLMTRLVATLVAVLALAGCTSTPPARAGARAAAHVCTDLRMPGVTWGHLLVGATRAAQLDDKWDGLYQAVSDLRDTSLGAADASVVRGVNRRITRECARARAARVRTAALSGTPGR